MSLESEALRQKCGFCKEKVHHHVKTCKGTKISGSQQKLW